MATPGSGRLHHTADAHLRETLLADALLVEFFLSEAIKRPIGSLCGKQGQGTLSCCNTAFVVLKQEEAEKAQLPVDGYPRIQEICGKRLRCRTAEQRGATVVEYRYASEAKLATVRSKRYTTKSKSLKSENTKSCKCI